MSRDVPRCATCKKRGAWTCEPCKTERRRLAALRVGEQARPGDSYPLAVLVEREVRIQTYRRRALRGLPLFTAGGAA